MIKPWFLTEEKFAAILIIPSSWGSQLGGHPARIKHNVLAPLPGKKKTSARGVSHAHPLHCFSFALLYFCLHRFIKNTQKNLVSFILVFTCLLLVLFE
jgi:hypothetical protein